MTPKNHFLRLAALLITALAWPEVCGAGTPAGPPAGQADAHGMVALAAESCARTIQALPPRQDGGVQPLRASLMSMEAILGTVGARLAAHDLDFFRALRSGSRTLAGLRVVWPRSGIHDPAVDGGIQTLSAVYARLRNRYGREWLRYRSGQPLGPEERQRFTAMREAEALLAERLEKLERKAQAAGDMVTAGELALLVSQAAQIARAPLSLEELLNASVLGDTIQGEYDATRAANPGDEPDWNQADQTIESLSTDASAGFVFAADLDTGKGWSYVDEPTAFPDALADALAVQPQASVPMAPEAAEAAEASEDDDVVAEPEETAAETPGMSVEPAETAEPDDTVEVLELPAEKPPAAPPAGPPKPPEHADHL